MIQKTDYYVDAISRAAKSAATFTAKFPKIDSPDYVIARSVAVSNGTTAAGTITIGIMYNNVALWIETIPIAVIGYFYKMKGTLVIPRHYQLVIKIAGHSTGDKIYANVTGEHKELVD